MKHLLWIFALWASFAGAQTSEVKGNIPSWKQLPPVPAGIAIGNPTSAGNVLDIQGASGSPRGIQMDTGSTERWNVAANNIAESGNNAGSQFAINAYTDGGIFINSILKANRSSGVFGDGTPAIINLAPFTQTNTLMPTPGGVIGNTYSASQTADVMPTYSLPSNPITTTNASPTVTINWPNCCGTGGPLSATKDSWVLVLNTGSPAVLNGLNVPSAISYFNGTGSQSGTTLTVATVNGGSLAVGSVVYGGSGLTGQVTAIISGTGGVGTYTFSTSATVGTVNLVSSPWLEVQSVVDANNFTVTWPNAATAAGTLGGTTLTIQPSVSGILKKTGSTSTAFSDGFPMQEQSLFTANPLSYIPTAAATTSIPRYQQFWTVFATPNDKSGLNSWTADYRETDLINRGLDGGYAPDLFTAPNRTVGFWTGPLAAPFSFNAGGGTATNWNTVYSCFGPTSVGIYDCNSVQPNVLVGAAQDPTGHGGVGYDFFGSYSPLAANPYKTTNGTTTVTITLASSRDVGGLVAGQSVYIPDTQYSSSGLNNVTFGGASYTIGVVGTNTITITGTGTANATGGGGGSSKYVHFAQYVPYAPLQFWGEFKHGLICASCRFDIDEINLPGYVVDQIGNQTTLSHISTGTAADQMQAGTTGQRPSSCVVGQQRLNTNYGALEYCSVAGTPGTWRFVNGSVVLPGCSGGQVSQSNVSTSETNLAVCKIPGGAMGAAGQLRFTILWLRTVPTTDSVTWTIRQSTSSGAVSGGNPIWSQANATSGVTGLQQVLMVGNSTSAANQAVAFNSSAVGALTGTITATPSNPGFNTAVDQYFNINGTTGTQSSSDTVGVYHWSVELIAP